MRVRHIYLTRCVWLTIVAAGAALGQNTTAIDEDALFGDTSVVMDIGRFRDTSGSSTKQDSTQLSISGQITASTSARFHREWFDDDYSRAHTSIYAAALSNLYADIRLPHSVKGFVNTEARADASYDTASFFLRELFLDWNVDRRFFFRAGKQVLQWGRGYFFTPVDMVNIEKVRFFDELSDREGTYGLKLHIPFRTRANLYTFVDMYRGSHVDSLAIALRAEFLLRSTEFAFSGWVSPEKEPVFGFDMSTGIGDVSVIAEAALYRALDTASLRWQAFEPHLTQITHTWVPRVSLGAGTWLDWGEIRDRIMVNAELYYNHAGRSARDFSIYVPPHPTGGQMTAMPPTLQDSIAAAMESAADSLFYTLVASNNVSKWYAATFVNISRFVISDLTCRMSVLYNLTQRSGMLSAALEYTTLHNHTFAFLVNGFVGDDYTEYTLSGQGLSLECRVGILF